MEVVQFENKRWSGWKQTVEFRHTAALTLIEGTTVLDLGCGDGLFLRLLKQKGVTAIGVDASDEAVRRCVEQGLEAHTASLTTPLPFPDHSFDTVTLLDVLEHTYDPEPLLLEAKRIAKQNVVVSVPNFSSLPARLQTLMGSVPENNRPNKGHIYWFNYHTFSRIVKNTGLSIDSLCMNTFSPASLFSSFFPRILPNIFALSFVASLSKV